MFPLVLIFLYQESTQKLWAKAVWTEGREKRDFEDVLPMAWINTDTKVVRWPVEDEGKKMKRHDCPEEDWQTFPLIKIKIVESE